MANIKFKDIANLAGVSTATVSRVLRRQGPISKETEERVLQAARELNFTPPPVPRCRSHHNLGMLIAGVDSPNPQSSFFHEVITGATAEADRRDLSLSVAPLASDRDMEPGLLRRHQVEGLVVAGVPLAEDLVIRLSRLELPVVFIGRYLENTPHNFVTPDNRVGGQMAARHLLDLGHRHICVLNGPTGIQTFKDRLAGVKEVITASGDVRLIVRDHFDEEAGYETTCELLQRGERPTAILALSDWMAIGCLRALREYGLRVPQDVSLVGFSDIPLASLLDPPLTTIHIPQRRLGELAVHLLQALLEDELDGPLGMVVPLKLAMRGSTAVPQG